MPKHNPGKSNSEKREYQKFITSRKNANDTLENDKSGEANDYLEGSNVSVQADYESTESKEKSKIRDYSSSTKVGIWLKDNWGDVIIFGILFVLLPTILYSSIFPGITTNREKIVDNSQKIAVIEEKISNIKSDINEINNVSEDNREKLTNIRLDIGEIKNKLDNIISDNN